MGEELPSEVKLLFEKADCNVPQYVSQENEVDFVNELKASLRENDVEGARHIEELIELLVFKDPYETECIS